MNSLALSNLFTRNFIGFEPLLRFGEGLVDTRLETNFPPHNIEKTDENQYRLTLAIAGFTRNDLSISLKSGVLTITGSQTDDDSTYLYHGIASRDFTKTFKVGEKVEVIAATIEHGLLVVDLERQVSEEDKPKLIEIK